MIGIDCTDVQHRELSALFFSHDVETVAKSLIGTFLFNGTTGGRIVETEAYCENDLAAHCYYDKRPREQRRFDNTRPLKQRKYFDAMYLEGAHVYVYADDSKKDVPVYCHLNFTTGPAGFGSAVLVRAIEPCCDSVEEMIGRRRKFVKRLNVKSLDQELCSGPQRLCQALGITGQMNGKPISETSLKLYIRKDEPQISCGHRVGVVRGAEKLRRYVLQGSMFVSERNNKNFPLPVDASGAAHD